MSIAVTALRSMVVFTLAMSGAVSNSFALSMPHEFQYSMIERIMAKTPKNREATPVGNMSRYIVQHTCKNSQVDEVANAVGNQPYSVLKVFEFTNQFLIETTPAGAKNLKKHRCVQIINEDTAVGPTSSG